MTEIPEWFQDRLTEAQTELHEAAVQLNEANQRYLAAIAARIALQAEMREYQ